MTDVFFLMLLIYVLILKNVRKPSILNGSIILFLHIFVLLFQCEDTEKQLQTISANAQVALFQAQNVSAKVQNVLAEIQDVSGEVHDLG